MRGEPAPSRMKQSCTCQLICTRPSCGDQAAPILYSSMGSLAKHVPCQQGLSCLAAFSSASRPSTCISVVSSQREGPQGRLPACMWRRVSLVAQIRSVEWKLLSSWRLRTIQYLMELAQPLFQDSIRSVIPQTWRSRSPATVEMQSG